MTPTEKRQSCFARTESFFWMRQKISFWMRKISKTLGWLKCDDFGWFSSRSSPSCLREPDSSTAWWLSPFWPILHASDTLHRCRQNGFKKCFQTTICLIAFRYSVFFGANPAQIVQISSARRTRPFQNIEGQTGNNSQYEQILKFKFWTNSGGAISCANLCI